jgi:hypothetical protein
MSAGGGAKKVSGPGGTSATEGAGEPRPTARRPPSHTSAGKFAKGNGLGPGRPKGSKDTKPRIGSIRAVYDELIETRGGHKLMLDAVEAGLKDKKRALGYLELGAKVLDRAEEEAGKQVHFHLHTNVDFTKLDEAPRKNGMIAPLAPPPGVSAEESTDPHIPADSKAPW